MDLDEKSLVIKNIIRYDNILDETKKDIINNQVIVGIAALIAVLATVNSCLTTDATVRFLNLCAIAVNSFNAGIRIPNIIDGQNKKHKVESEYNDYLDSLDSEVSINKTKHCLKIEFNEGE